MKLHFEHTKSYADAALIPLEAETLPGSFP